MPTGPSFSKQLQQVHPTPNLATIPAVQRNAIPSVGDGAQHRRQYPRGAMQTVTGPLAQDAATGAFGRGAAAGAEQEAQQERKQGAEAGTGTRG